MNCMTKYNTNNNVCLGEKDFSNFILSELHFRCDDKCFWSLEYFGSGTLKVLDYYSQCRQVNRLCMCCLKQQKIAFSTSLTVFTIFTRL